MVLTLVKVVSMKGSSARRESFEKLAEAADLNWEFFDARTQAEEPLSYSESLSRRRFGRPLSKGEVGCYVSHYKLWEELLTSPADQMIVLEDDVIVDWNALKAIAEFDCGVAGIDVLRLFATHPFRFVPAMYRFLSEHHHIVRSKGFAFGTQGYLVTRRGAEAFLAGGTTIYEPVDWRISRYWDYRLPCYVIFPFPILERHATSTIGSAGRETTTPASWMERSEKILRKIQSRFRREIYDRLVLPKRPFENSSDTGAAFVSRGR